MHFLCALMRDGLSIRTRAEKRVPVSMDTLPCGEHESVCAQADKKQTLLLCSLALHIKNSMYEMCDVQWAIQCW